MEYIENHTQCLKMLSTYINQHGEGAVNGQDADTFLRIFEQSYKPDNNETRYDIAEIDGVRIQRTAYGNKCFAICRNGVWIPTSIKKMCGIRPTTTQILHRAMRYAIEPQIAAFRAANRLNMLAPCPITGDYLGPDAQVDHVIPFHVLANHYLSKNSGITYFYSMLEKNYVIEQPDRAKWQRFHQKYAKLRWLSKEANQTAHLEFQNLNNQFN